VSDSEGYNTVDAERAQNAVQFLEQIQLNGNTSILHNVTLSTIAEDDKDEDEDEMDSPAEQPLATLSSALQSEKSLQDNQFGPISELQQLQVLAQAGSVSLPKLQAQVLQQHLQQQQQQQHVAQTQHQAPPTSLLQQAPSQQQVQHNHLQQQPQGVKRSAEDVLREAKGSKKLAAASSSSTAPAVTTTAAADKLLQAKQRRERLEEEERRRKEEQVKKTTERDQRARALKAGPAEAKPTKAAILEKSKRNAELLVKSKVVEAGKKKMPAAIPAPSAASVSAPAQQQAQQQPQPMSEKKGLFGAFKNLKQGGSKKLASSSAEPKENAGNRPAESAAAAAAASPARSPGPRPSPLRKAAGPNSNVSPRLVKSPEANLTQYSISPMKESDAEEQSSAAKQAKKREAKWAKSDALMAALRLQNLEVADEVFGVPIGLTCNLSEVFEGYKRKPVYSSQARSSSAQWSDVPKGPFANATNKK